MIGTFFRSVESVSIILILTIFGFVFGKMGIINDDFKARTSRLLIVFVIPLSCIYAIKVNLSQELVLKSLSWTAMVAISLGSNFIVSFIVGKLMKIPQYRLGVFMMAASLSNSLFIGYAMCTEIFGVECAPFVMIYYCVLSAYTQLIGVTLVQWSSTGEAFSLKKIVQFVKTPPVVGIVVALILVYFDIGVPNLVMSVLKYFNNLISPLAIFVTGYIIYSIGLSKLKIDRDMIALMIIKFLFSPAMMIFLCRSFGVTGLARSVFIAMSAMPSIAQSAVCAAAYGADEAFAARAVSISTLASFIVIPVLMLIIN